MIPSVSVRLYIYICISLSFGPLSISIHSSFVYSSNIPEILISIVSKSFELLVLRNERFIVQYNLVLFNYVSKNIC